jgi:hypothetical protein
MKTLKVTNEWRCTGCKMCALAVSRKLGLGLSLEKSYIKVMVGDNCTYKVCIDVGHMTEELTEYASRFCPMKILEVVESD